MSRRSEMTLFAVCLLVPIGFTLIWRTRTPKWADDSRSHARTDNDRSATLSNGPTLKEANPPESRLAGVTGLVVEEIRMPPLSALDRMQLEGDQAGAHRLRIALLGALSQIGAIARAQCERKGIFAVEKLAETIVRVHVRARFSDSRGELAEILGLEQARGPALPKRTLACLERELRNQVPVPVTGKGGTGLSYDNDAFLNWALVTNSECPVPSASAETVNRSPTTR
jgi:hypothetical protein